MWVSFIPIDPNIDFIMNLSENIAYTSFPLPKHILNIKFNIKQYASRVSDITKPSQTTLTFPTSFNGTGAI